MENLLEIFKQYKTGKGTPLSEVSIKNYIAKLNKISKLVLNKDYQSYEFLLKPITVINKLKKSNLKNYKDYMSPIINLLKAVNVDNNIIKQYQNVLQSQADISNQEREQNQASATDKERIMTMFEIKNKIASYKDTTPEQLLNKFIVAFYFYNSFVPRNDLSKFKIVEKKKDTNDTNYNYILVNSKTYSPELIVMNNYKTASTYGRQEFPINPYIKEVFEEYIVVYDIKPNQFLFQSKDGEEINDNTFLQTIKRAMIDVFGKPLNIDLIRSIILTDFYSRPKTVAQKKEQARKMLHDYNTSQQYVIVDSE